MDYNWLIINELGFRGKKHHLLGIFLFLRNLVLIFGSLIYLSYITYIKQKTYSVGYYIKDNGRNSKTHP